MNKDKERENFRYYAEHTPEGKIELADGRVLVGNGLDGSRLLLDHIVRGWSTDAATALGPTDLWLAALREAYGPIADLDANPPRVEWRAPDWSAGGEGPDGGHRRVREHLAMAFFPVGEELGGEALGRIVMRLGDNGFTPDLMFFGNTGRNTILDYGLQGPAEIAIEILRPAHRDYDVRVKREYYASGGVPEYWIVDPERRTVDFLRLENGAYQPQKPEPDGFYRPAIVPGLAVQAENLWPKSDHLRMREEHNPFVVERSGSVKKRKMPSSDDDAAALPFDPHVALQPVPVLFDEYIAWAPEAKFEFFEGRIQLSGEEGVRNMAGLLLATLGLVEACRLAPPEEWLASLRRRRGMEQRQQAIRAEWRQRALNAAELLRAKYQPQRVAITGSLLSPDPITFWSQLSLALWGVSFQQMHQIYQDLSEMDIDVLEADNRWFQQRVDRGEYKLEDI